MADMLCPGCGARFKSYQSLHDWRRCDDCGAEADFDPDSTSLPTVISRPDAPPSMFTPAVVKDLQANKAHYERLHDRGDLHNGKVDIAFSPSSPDRPDRPPKFVNVGAPAKTKKTA